MFQRAALLAAQTGWKDLKYYDAMYFFITIPIVFIYGIVVGSFLNVVIIRIPRGESLIKRASHCMTCGTKIRIIDLIPVFSWLFLRGKCHSCGEKISPRYPIVESLTGLLFVANFLVFGGEIFSFNLLLMCIFTALLICIGFIDWDTLEMYDIMSYLIAALAIPSHFLTDSGLTVWDRLIGAACISVPFFIIGEISGIVIKKKTGEKVRGIELGDSILMACAGLYLGWKAMIPAAFTGILLAAIFGIIIKAVKKGESKMAFGPYLCMGLLIGAMFGEEMTNSYLEFFLSSMEPDQPRNFYTSLIHLIPLR
ncbi:MAG: prepilin peptidase [Oscillospiraceae bacterium]|nr:prepilin peptidase [Oscillospiraceae bacterium]